MSKCTCVVRPWFVGIANPNSDENTVIYFNGCEIHTPKEDHPVTE
jgi:hypothetical protein